MQWEAHPDPAWVAALAGVSESRAADALDEASGEKRLFRHLEREHRSGGRPSYIEIDAPFELYAIVRLVRPRHIVEVGVSSGVSSAYLLRACQRNGRGTLHSVDLPKLASAPSTHVKATTASWVIPPGRGSGWAVPFPLRARWDLRLGDKRVVVPLLAEELPSVEMSVYDVPHSEHDAGVEFRALDSRMKVGGVAIADHGPGGGLCDPLRRWARRRRSVPVRCQDLGLWGFRVGRAHRSAPAG
jgi:Methyltransferase domain